jgi:hypothetical protein
MQDHLDATKSLEYKHQTMAFVLPSHFSEDVNHLGTVVRMYDSTRRKETLRGHLLTGMELSCSLLKDLHGSAGQLAEGIDQIDSTNEAAAKLVHQHPDLFLRIEDLILRDVGIDKVTRNIIFGNVRRMRWLAESDVHTFDGKTTITTLANLRNEVCERAIDLAGNPDRVKKALEKTVTFGIAPINAAVAVSHPAFLPVVFKASALVGTIVSRAIPSR